MRRTPPCTPTSWTPRSWRPPGGAHALCTSLCGTTEDVPEHEPQLQHASNHGASRQPSEIMPSPCAETIGHMLHCSASRLPVPQHEYPSPHRTRIRCFTWNLEWMFHVKQRSSGSTMFTANGDVRAYAPRTYRRATSRATGVSGRSVHRAAPTAHILQHGCSMRHRALVFVHDPHSSAGPSALSVAITLRRDHLLSPSTRPCRHRHR